MHQTLFGRREKTRIRLSGLNDGLAAARKRFSEGAYLAGIDLYEQLAAAYPEQGISVLAELYDSYLLLPNRDRYHLYQARHFDFGIVPGDKVLDVGSGHMPFPLATHLCDITVEDHSYGRGGVPVRHLAGKPFYECPVESMPFADKEFDFVYCSHVLEHSKDPEQACRELMRIARRGYIETPTRAKDIFLAGARVSNHLRSVELIDGRLVFREYTPLEIQGLGCDILQGMHSNPQSEREKAFAALIWLKADVVNTMLLWDGSFEFEVIKPRSAAAPALRPSPSPEPVSGTVSETADKRVTEPASEPAALGFLQVHTFYPSYLDEFYRRHPDLSRASFDEQVNALVRDAFSGIHIFAPYLGQLGYAPHFVVANNPYAQAAWLKEQGISYTDQEKWLHDIVRLQIEALRPEVLYLSDPINFDSSFVRSLSYTPRLVFGWRAANIPPSTDWSSFDIMLSSLASLREVALKLGARAAEHFFPGFPCWINQAGSVTEPNYDVVFTGSWTADQHARRNGLVTRLAQAASAPDTHFSLALYLNAAPEQLPAEVRRYNHGPRFGVAMHDAVRSGRIVVDARGTLEYRDPRTAAVTDLAQHETANMRIFEVTGSGRLLLTEQHNNLSRYFQPGVEIETFRDEAELMEKIAYYLEHPEEREAIARRGQQRCLAEYSMQRRAEELDGLIRRHLAMAAPRRELTEDADALKERAAKLLEKSQVAEAFDVLIRAKALKTPLEGLDLLRARCFQAMGQPLAARQALLEELRLFPENETARIMLEGFEPAGCSTASHFDFDPEFQQLLGVIRPYSMLGELRLYSLFQLAKHICLDDIPGNFVECGVAAGGSSALLAYVVKSYSKRPRTLYSFDSFSGMPAPGKEDIELGSGRGAEETGWGTGTCAAPVDSLLMIARKLGVLSIVKPVKGYYEETLPRIHDLVGEIAFIHIDSDWYESTRTILDNLYDQIHPRAMIQFDDYGYWKGCGKALHEFENERGLTFAINPIDGTGVWFSKAEVARTAIGSAGG